MWKLFKTDDLDLCLKQPGEFFMVRQIGVHPGRGVKYVPIIVQLIGGSLYTAENEIDPLIFGHMKPIENPFDANLEWMELPE